MNDSNVASIPCSSSRAGSRSESIAVSQMSHGRSNGSKVKVLVRAGAL